MTLPAALPSSGAAARTCPRCPGAALFPLESRAGTLWWCPACEGHLVSREVEPRLLPLLEAVVSPVAERPRNACISGKHALRPGQEHCGECPTEGLRCPGCGRRMRLYARGGVTVDVCTGCPGVWLDAGELPKLREALVPLLERARATAGKAVETTMEAIPDAFLRWDPVEVAISVDLELLD